MKVLVSLLVLALVGYSIAASSGRGCIYVNGHCQRGCEEGTHSYGTGCGPLTPEATCENPEPTPDPRGGHICDFTACYCDAPTVRHDGKCIPLDQCPKDKLTEAPEPKKE